MTFYTSARSVWPLDTLCSWVARPFVVTKLVNTNNILKTNKLIFMQIVISCPRGNGMKWSTLGVRRSKVKVTQGQR